MNFKEIAEFCGIRDSREHYDYQDLVKIQVEFEKRVRDATSTLDLIHAEGGLEDLKKKVEIARELIKARLEACISKSLSQ